MTYEERQELRRLVSVAQKQRLEANMVRACLCLRCYQPYEPPRGKQRKVYCSDACRRAANQERWPQRLRRKYRECVGGCGRQVEYRPPHKMGRCIHCYHASMRGSRSRVAA